jgi:hypothetical protein
MRENMSLAFFYISSLDRLKAMALLDEVVALGVGGLQVKRISSYRVTDY